MHRFAVLGNVFLWIGTKTDFTKFYQHQQPERSHQHVLGNNTGLLRLVSTLVDFPTWMDLLATGYTSIGVGTQMPVGSDGPESLSSLHDNPAPNHKVVFATYCSPFPARST